MTDTTAVIVGGGAAGATAALTLRDEGFDGRVVLLSAEPHPPYNRPPLSKALVRGEIEPERIHLRPAKVWERKDVEMRLGRTATTLDPDAHAVVLDDGETLGYDSLLLATGGRARVLPEWSRDERVHTLRRLDDALALRELVCSKASLAIVGAGFVGAELAASAVQMGCAVTVFEAAPMPLSRLLPPSLGQVYADLHRARGVDLRLGVTVGMIGRQGTKLHVADSAGGGVVADAVVVAVGMEPDVALARSAGLAVADGILVDEHCRTSAPDVYAAGDAANHPNRLLGRRIRIEHWQHAQHHGAAAARAMLGAGDAFDEVPWVWSDQYAHRLEIAGIPRPDDEVVVRGDPGSLDFTAYLLRDGILAAAVGLNRADDVRAAREAIARGIELTPASLADPEFAFQQFAK